jgi:hypothetical protein
MEGCHTFGFTHLIGYGKTYWLVTETMVQRIIDGVNNSLKENPDAWEFVREGGLIQEEKEHAPVGKHPVAKAVFAEMMKDDHTGATAMASVRLVTDLARQRGLELGLGRIE